MQQSKSNKDQSIDVPREIVIDIVSRLPTRTIIKCKVVCKEWSDAIECVEFTQLRLSKPDPEPYPYLIIPTYPIYKIFELKGRDPFLDKVIKFSLPHNVGVRGTVNGLIFLGELSHLFICNPITREFVKLPNHHRRPHSSFNYNSYGFGVSRTSGQYKVVRIFNTQPECQVYNLGTKEGRTIAAGGPPPPHYPPHKQISTNRWNTKCVFAGGNLYWLDNGTQTEVCCFDLETEAFASFATPLTPVGHPRDNQRCLYVSDDRLRLCNVVWTNNWPRSVEVVEMWSMRGGGDWILSGRGTSVSEFPIKVWEDGEMLLTLLWEEKSVGKGYSLLFLSRDGRDRCESYLYKSALCNLSFLSLKTLFARDDVQRFVD